MTAARVLAELAAANFLVSGHAGSEIRYRYHGLLLEFLRAQLRRTRPHDLGLLQRLSARWHWQAHEPVPAFRDALAGGDWDLADEIAAEAWHVVAVEDDGAEHDALVQLPPEVDRRPSEPRRPERVREPRARGPAGGGAAAGGGGRVGSTQRRRCRRANALLRLQARCCACAARRRLRAARGGRVGARRSYRRPAASTRRPAPLPRVRARSRTWERRSRRAATWARRTRSWERRSTSPGARGFGRWRRACSASWRCSRRGAAGSGGQSSWRPRRSRTQSSAARRSVHRSSVPSSRSAGRSSSGTTSPPPSSTSIEPPPRRTSPAIAGAGSLPPHCCRSSAARGARARRVPPWRSCAAGRSTSDGWQPPHALAPILETAEARLLAARGDLEAAHAALDRKAASSGESAGDRTAPGEALRSPRASRRPRSRSSSAGRRSS